MPVILQGPDGYNSTIKMTTKTTREKIVKAAIKRNGKVYTGFRHALVLDSMRIDGVVVNVENPLKMDEQGFVTNTGRFVDRVEAANIAFKAGQIRSGISSLDSYQIFK